MRIILIVLFILLFLSVFRLFSNNGGIIEQVQLSKQLQEIQLANQALEDRNSLLVKEVLDLTQGLDAVESLARSQLGLIAKDEVFVKLIELEPEVVARPLPESKASEAVEQLQPIEIQ